MTATAAIITLPVERSNGRSTDTDRMVREAFVAAEVLNNGDRSKQAIKRASYAALACANAGVSDAASKQRLDDAWVAVGGAVRRAKETDGDTKVRESAKDRETAAQIARQSHTFHDAEGTAYATISVDGHNETVAVRSSRFKHWITLQFREAKGKAPGSDALTVAVNEVEAVASLEGPQCTVYTRLAHVGDCLYLDLCDEQWRAVQIDPDGWQVITKPPVKFIRSKDARPLPVPVRDGSLDELRPFVNVESDADWKMLVAWLVGALAPAGPYPILMLYGEQGSAKSSTARALRALIDPVGTKTRSRPKDEHDLAIAARGCWALVFDNLSSLSTEMSNALCRVATGAGLGTRKLYTDAEESTFYAQRPIIINGIETVATRGDLIDRAIVLQLPRLQIGTHRDEATLNEEFAAALPGILGALLDALSTALRNWDDTRLEYTPRMADFTRWVVASEAVPEFVEVYAGKRKEAIAEQIEADVFASAVLAFTPEQGEWKGTAAELLAALDEAHDPRERAWPENAHQLGNRMTAIAPALRSQGIGVELGIRSNGRRLISLRSFRA